MANDLGMMTCDVAVIGAGLAGLAAADSLAREGVNVLVLEREPRVGGRVWTHREPGGAHFELGAFSFSDSEKTLWDLVTHLGLEVIPHSPIDREFICDGLRGRFSDNSSSLFKSEIELTFNELLRACLEKVRPDKDDQSLGQAFRKAGIDEKVIRWLENNTLLGLLGEGFDSVSAKGALEYFRQYLGSKQFYAVKGGNDFIAEALAQKLKGKIFCQFPIAKMERCAQRWLLHGEGKSVSAEHVIFALPIPALQQIVITPPLSDPKRMAMEQVRYTPCTRVSLIAPPGQSKEVRGGVFAISDGWLRDQSAFQAIPHTVLNQSFVGKNARQIKEMDPQACQKQFLASLRQFVPDFNCDSLSFHIHSWDGGYSYFPPQTFHFKEELAKPEDSLFFCGEHTSNKPASMNGALESGNRAVREVTKLQRALKGEIIPIHSLLEIEMYLPREGKTLAVVDLDDTAIVLNDPDFQLQNFNDVHKDVFHEKMKELELNELERLLAFTLPLITTPAKLIEESTPQLFERLRARPNTKVVALTAAMGWKLDEERSVEGVRIQGLRDINIDFSHFFPEISAEIEFSKEAFPNIKMGRHPFFKEGVILANDQDKGIVSVHFLNAMIWIPDLIVAIDDKIGHLERIIQAMRIHYPNVKVIALHYQTPPGIYGISEVDSFKRKWTAMGEWAREIFKSRMVSK